MNMVIQIYVHRYQASFSTFQKAGYSREDAVQIMLKSVKLANEARRRFVEERDDINGDDVRIALSFGPYGASLSPAQEFDGFYPPPYGPKEFSKEEDNCNAFDDEVAIENSVSGLTQFHLERLRVFARSPEAWIGIDCIAWETVPLTREIRAIRKAVGLLQQEENFTKPWWISLVFPDGRYPETELPGGQNLNVRQVAEVAMGNQSPSNPLPKGVGLNCMQVEHFPVLLRELQEAVDNIWEKGMDRPWLVMYPNGGDVYDPVTRSWQIRSSVDAWADNLVGTITKQPTWGGVLVGGCCRTGPEEISALYELLSAG
jgi:homocysteine S-methyltransferase